MLHILAAFSVSQSHHHTANPSSAINDHQLLLLSQGFEKRGSHRQVLTISPSVKTVTYPRTNTWLKEPTTYSASSETFRQRRVNETTLVSVYIYERRVQYRTTTRWSLWIILRFTRTTVEHSSRSSEPHSPAMTLWKSNRLLRSTNNLVILLCYCFMCIKWYVAAEKSMFRPFVAPGCRHVAVRNECWIRLDPLDAGERTGDVWTDQGIITGWFNVLLNYS